MNYIEELESYFHPNWLGMESNQDMKKWQTIAYVKMLELMCKDRKVFIEKRPFEYREPAILVLNGKGAYDKWIIDEELDTTYRIRFLEAITHVRKDMVQNRDGKYYFENCWSTRKKDGTIKLNYIEVPEEVSRNTLTYLIDTGQILSPVPDEESVGTDYIVEHFDEWKSGLTDDQLDDLEMGLVLDDLTLGEIELKQIKAQERLDEINEHDSSLEYPEEE